MILIHIASGSLSCVLVVLPSLLGWISNFSSYFLGVIWRALLGGEHFWFLVWFHGGRRASVCIVHMERAQLSAITGRVSRGEGAAAI